MDKKIAAPLTFVAVLFVAAGGFVHLREWLETYRDVPARVPGSEVVVIGFPLHVAASVLAVAALVGAAGWKPAWLRIVAVGTAAFQASALAVLVATREGTVLGWTEPTYTRGAEQSLAVEIGALVMLAALVGLDALRRRDDGYAMAPAVSG